MFRLNSSAKMNTVKEIIVIKPGSVVIYPAEFRIIKMIAAGFSDKEIRKELGISQRTINTHITNVFRKMGVNCRAGMVIVMLQIGALGTWDLMNN
jgi:DNA-binding NarL/FixJ family response regulator